MPTDQRALTRAVRARMKATGVRYTDARAEVAVIQEIAEENDFTFAEAEAEYDDPRNQVMCDGCGWTYGMVCPECPGCGCYNGRCSGWRHAEFEGDFVEPEDREVDCDECGGSFNSDTGYGCACNPG